MIKATCDFCGYEVELRGDEYDPAKRLLIGPGKDTTSHICESCIGAAAEMIAEYRKKKSGERAA